MEEHLAVAVDYGKAVARLKDRIYERQGSKIQGRDLDFFLIRFPVCARKRSCYEGGELVRVNGEHWFQVERGVHLATEPLFTDILLADGFGFGRSDLLFEVGNDHAELGTRADGNSGSRRSPHVQLGNLLASAIQPGCVVEEGVVEGGGANFEIAGDERLLQHRGRY